MIKVPANVLAVLAKNPLLAGLLIVVVAAGLYMWVFNGDIPGIAGSFVSDVDSDRVSLVDTGCNSITSCKSYIDTEASVPQTVKDYIAANPNKLVCESERCFILKD